MKKYSLNRDVCLAAMVCTVVLMAAQALAADFKTVVVVSIDALHPDALTEDHAPLTWKMLEKGSLTLRGKSTNPPKTLVAHAAMMTGIGPEAGGRLSNLWNDGEPTVQGWTLFHAAKDHGYRTGYFYSKPKLGFLDSSAVDESVLSDDATGTAVQFLKGGEHNFVFIHISGLDIVGPEYGWLSTMYLEELSYIDQYLADVYEYLNVTGSYLLIVTSDHAGYEKKHGGSHPDEARLPFGVVSDICAFPEVTDAPYSVTHLPDFLERAMSCSP